MRTPTLIPLAALCLAAVAHAVRPAAAPSCTTFVRAGFVPAAGPAAADGRSPAIAVASPDPTPARAPDWLPDLGAGCDDTAGPSAD